MEEQKKILVIMPRFPHPESGACEQDRAENLRQLMRLGYRVHVIAKKFSWQSEDTIRALWEPLGLMLTLVPYAFQGTSWIDRWKKWFFFLTHPWCLDGSALEYAEPVMQQATRSTLQSFRPHVVWFDYTYLWPLYRLVKRAGRPMIVRSINVEAYHYLDEEGATMLHWLKAVPKFMTEWITARTADVLCAITPQEAVWYEKRGAKRVTVVPLRSLYDRLGTHTPAERKPLRVFFAGSTYFVAHNRRALLFVIDELAPLVEQRYPGAFTFHIFGGKLPEDIRSRLRGSVYYEGYVPDFEKAMKTMDIALAPSLFGAGMQQKIFEPLSRGFPTITHARGLVGYSYTDGTDVLLAKTAAAYCEALGTLLSYERRVALSQQAIATSTALFRRDIVDGVVQKEIQHLS